MNTIDTACQWAKPIRVGAGDVLTDATAREILAHNKSFIAACGKEASK